MSSKRRGALYAIGAYLMWGVLPVYWKLLQGVPAPQILAHRVVWSFGFLLVLILIRREFRALWDSVNLRHVGAHAIAAIVLWINWLVYIWAVNAGRIVEASLGYFINPLVSVVLGVIFFGERLSPMKWLAVTMAALGVGYLTWQLRALPWVALVLAGTFALYGLLKKKAPLRALHGLAFETGVLWFPAAIYLGLLELHGYGEVGRVGPWTLGLLLFTGVVTGLPLLLFAAAAQRINLSTIGILQYIAPSCQLFIGVAVYHEPFDQARWLGFAFIWMALAIYSIESLRGMGRGID